MKFMLLVCLFTAAVLSALSMHCLGQTPAARDSRQLSPIGRWKTVDDVTGKVTSVVLLWEENGTLYGTIENLIPPDPHDPNPRCTQCEGAMKDKPLIGLRILWGLRHSDDRWSGGQIVDPDNGKTYRCEIVVKDGGNKLQVRGYIGFSFMGRTEYWLREK